MKILVTGFEPFGGEKVNPSYEAVKRLPDCIAGAGLIKRMIPTSFSRGWTALEESVRIHVPDTVICIGQAGGRAEVTLEQTAVNLMDSRIPDNDGVEPKGERILADGPDAYFTNLPLRRMAENIHTHGLPCQISYTAGTFVCNCVMYRLMHMIHQEFPEIKGGFIHVPYLPEQAAKKPGGTPSMSLMDIVLSLQWALEAVGSRGTANGNVHIPKGML